MDLFLGFPPKKALHENAQQFRRGPRLLTGATWDPFQMAFFSWLYKWGWSDPNHVSVLVMILQVLWVPWFFRVSRRMKSYTHLYFVHYFINRQQQPSGIPGFDFCSVFPPPSFEPKRPFPSSTEAREDKTWTLESFWPKSARARTGLPWPTVAP